MKLSLELDLYVQLSPLNPQDHVPTQDEMLEDLRTWLAIKRSEFMGLNGTRIQFSEKAILDVEEASWNG